jgi:hypothetical protein
VSWLSASRCQVESAHDQSHRLTVDGAAAIIVSRVHDRVTLLKEGSDGKDPADLANRSRISCSVLDKFAAADAFARNPAAACAHLRTCTQWRAGRLLMTTCQTVCETTDKR